MSRLKTTRKSLTTENKKYVLRDIHRRIRSVSNPAQSMNEKKSLAAKYRDKISEVGCVLFEVERVRIVQGLLMNNATLEVILNGIAQRRTKEASRSVLNEGGVRHNLIQTIGTDSLEFERQVEFLRQMSAIVRKQNSLQAYDQHSFELLVCALTIVKRSIKQFWNSLIKQKEQTRCLNT